MGHSFTWASGASGLWITPGNWFDVTSGSQPTAAPTKGDSAVIIGPAAGAITITGPAEATELAIQGGMTLAGTFSISALTLGNPPFAPGTLPSPVETTATLSGELFGGTITVGGLHLDPSNPSSQIDDSSTLVVAAGATIHANAIDVTAGALRLDGGTATFTGQLQVGLQEYVFNPLTRHTANGAVMLVNHADLRVDGLRIDEGSVSLDPTSTLEIGAAGTAAPGTITVDPGATFSGGPSFDAPTFISGPLLNNGTVISSFPLSNVVNNGLLQINQDISDVVNNNIIFAYFGNVSNISGAGLIEVGDFLILGSNVSNVVNFPTSLGTIWVGHGIQTTAQVSGFSPGNEIRFLGDGPADVLYQSTGPGVGNLLLEQGGQPLVTMPLLGTYSNTDFSVAFDGFDSIVHVACFASGTRISTRRGDVRIEDLTLSDDVATFGGQFRGVRWIGSCHIRLELQPSASAVSPIRVAAHAFADAVPRRDLYLSPDHAAFVDDVLIPIKYLINGETIVQVHRRSVTYWHVELDTHDIIFANGLPAETFLRTGDCAADDCGIALQPAIPSLAWETRGCAPLVLTGPVLANAQRRLRERAIALRRDSEQKRRTTAGRQAAFLSA